MGFTFSTIIPFNKSLDDKTSEAFKTLMKKELDNSMHKIQLETDQSIENYYVDLYYYIRPEDIFEKFLEIKVKMSLKRIDIEFLRDLAYKIFEEILNPIRQNVLNAMGNDLRVDYKPIGRAICYDFG